MPPRQKKAAAASSSASSSKKETAKKKATTTTKKATTKKTTAKETSKTKTAKPAAKSRGTKRKAEDSEEEEEDEEAPEKAASAASRKAKSTPAPKKKQAAKAATTKAPTKRPRASAKSSAAVDDDGDDDAVAMEDDAESAAEDAVEVGMPMDAEAAKQLSVEWVNRLSRMTPNSPQATKAVTSFAVPSILSQLYWGTRGPKQRTLLLEFCRVYLPDKDLKPYSPEAWAAILNGVTTQGYDLATVMIGPNKENTLHTFFAMARTWAASKDASATFRGIVEYFASQGDIFVRMLGAQCQSRQIPWNRLMETIRGSGWAYFPTNSDIDAAAILVSKATATAMGRCWMTFVQEQLVLQRSVIGTLHWLQAMTKDELKQVPLKAKFSTGWGRPEIPGLYNLGVDRFMNNPYLTPARLFLHLLDVLRAWQLAATNSASSSSSSAAPAAAGGGGSSAAAAAAKSSEIEPKGPPSSSLLPSMDYLPKTANARDRATPIAPVDIHKWLREFEESIEPLFATDKILKLFDSSKSGDETNLTKGLELLQGILDDPNRPLALLTCLPHHSEPFLSVLLRLSPPTPALKAKIAGMFPALLSRIDKLPSETRFGYKIAGLNPIKAHQPSLLERILVYALPTDDSASLITRLVKHLLQSYKSGGVPLDTVQLFASCRLDTRINRAKEWIPVLKLFQDAGIPLDNFGAVIARDDPTILEWWLLENEGRKFSMTTDFPSVDFVAFVLKQPPNPFFRYLPNSTDPQEGYWKTIQKSRERWNGECLPRLRNMIESQLIPDLARIVMQYAVQPCDDAPGAVAAEASKKQRQ